MLRLIRPHRGLFVTLSALSFAGALLEAGFLVVVTGTAVAITSEAETVGPVAGRTFPIGVALGIATVALVIRLALALAGAKTSAQLSVAISSGLRRRLAQSYLRVSWAVQQAEPSGRLQELLTSFVNQATSAANSLTALVSASLSLTALLVAALMVDPVATLAVVGALAVLGVTLAPLRRRIRLRATAFAKSSTAFANAIAELGALGLEMQTYGVRERFVERIDHLTAENARANARVTTLRGALPQVYTAMAYGAFIAGVALVAVAGVGDLTALGAVMLLMLRSLSFGQQVQTASGGLHSTLPFLDRLEDATARYDAAKAQDGDVMPSEVTPIDVRDVSFAYVPDRPVLGDVSLTVEPGEVVGLIGPSGSGKSTLAQLLLGLREPSDGAIAVGGADLRDVARSAWTRRVAFVAQDAHLITGTVAENIRFFRDGIDDATLRRAARAANLLGDIERLPEGFETHLGERGSQLSGGQRQRLSIARALAGDPEVLILDEPTSALDVRSEALIRQTLTDLRGTVTVIVIAHRMSTLDMCDRIAVIEHGRLTAFDTPDALREDSEFYRHALALSGIS